MAEMNTSRRALLKRGAIVGSAAIWMPPVAQSLFVPAAAGTPAPPPPEPKRAFTFSLDDNHNQPVVRLTNNSDPGVQITGLGWTIGDTAYNFDAAFQESGPLGFTRNSPDGDETGGARSNVVIYSFTGFDTAETFRFRVDFDPDSFDAPADYRTILFNNGGAANSTVQVNFSSGAPLVLTLPDDGTPDATYSFSMSS